MKLILSKEDLKPEFENIETVLVEFDNFKENVKKIIIIIGKATYISKCKLSYVDIFPTQKN